ncbi:MAG: LamG-like jellyroll fold domain-containing protein [Planctomycetota bacterium]
MAIHLSGSNFVRAPSTSVASGATAFTTAMWVNFRTIDSTDDGIMLLGADDSGSRQIMLWRDAVGQFDSTPHCLSALVGRGGTQAYSVLSGSANTLAPARAEQWIHIACTWQANFGFRLFIDGVPDAKQGVYSTQSSYIPTGSVPYELGFSGATREPDLWMAEHALWPNTVLSDSEIGGLAHGISPLALINRVANLAAYQDLIAGPNRPGIGPAFAEVGSPAKAAHPRLLSPAGACSPRPAAAALFLKLASAQQAAAGAAAAGAFTAGAQAGLSFPTAEANP